MKIRILTLLLMSFSTVAHAIEWGEIVTNAPGETMESGHVCFYDTDGFVSCSGRGIGVDAAGDVSVSGVITLPAVTGVSGISQTVPGDNLGNHTATQSLDMDSNAITNGGAADVANIQLTNDTAPGCTASGDAGKMYYSSTDQRFYICR